MRFRRLRLLAFGPFTDVDIDFSDGPALHVIYGPNEAGKSTALRAITGLLYGIPATTRDAHVHEMRDLLIGGVLAKNGTSIDVLRRKGNKNTLLAADSREPMSELTLRGMLGGVDEATFRAMFGLDHVTLRQGAEALLHGRGSVGESLFDAGVGGRGIQKTLHELREEADALFRPRGRTQSINEALRLVREARERRNRDSVRPEAWVLQSEDIARLRKVSQEAVAKRRELAAEQSALQRARRVLPLLAKRAGRIAEREALGDVVRLERGASQVRIGLQRELEQAQRDVQRLEREIEEREAARNGLEIPEALLAVGVDVVEEIQGRLGSYRKAQADMPKRVAELRALESEVARLCVAVDRDPTPEVLAAATVGVRVQASVRRLATKRAALDSGVEDRTRRLAERKAAGADLEAHVARSAESPDTRALLSSLNQSRGAMDQNADLDRLEAELLGLESALDRSLAKLDPFRGGVTELRRLHLLSSEAIERFSRDFDRLSAAEADIGRRRNDQQRRERVNRRDLKAMSEGGSLVGESDLASARSFREELWSKIRDSEKAVSARSAKGFENATRAADEVADRLRREADRCAKLASLQADAALLDEESKDIDREAEDVLAQREELQKRWRDQRCVSVDKPAEMKDWHARAVDVLQRADEVEGLAEERSVRSARLEQSRDDLRAQLAAVGAKAKSGATLPDLVQVAAACCEDWSKATRDRELLLRSLDAAAGEIAREERSLEEQNTLLEQWRGEWNKAMADLGLPEDVPVEEGVAVLDSLVSLSSKATEAEAMQQRVAAIEFDLERFERDIEELVVRHSPELGSLSAAEAAEHLVRRYHRAVSDDEARRRIDTEIAERREQASELAAQSDDLVGRLDALRLEAAVPNVAGLEEAERRSEKAAELDSAIEEIETELLESGDGADVDQLIEETSRIEIDEVYARIDELADELDALDAENRRTDLEIGSKEEGLRVLENERGAAGAAEAEQQSLARLRSHVQRYVRVKLAAEILDAEVERYRQLNQGPILIGANQLFPKLTLDRYSELRVGYDDRDEEVLRCVRADGAEVGVEALSDGTRDQLYLALRLATLEYFGKNNDPLPLVLDDVFIHFDDERAAAALQVLGEYAATNQVLFFTHHERLRELARRVVPSERRVEHDLAAMRAGDKRL